MDSGGTHSLYVNGALQETNTNWDTGGNASDLLIGRSPVDTGHDFKGYMMDMRLVRGKKVYTGNFTPPTGPLTTTGGEYPSSTNISNPTASETKFLFSGTNTRIKDISTSNRSFTVYGTVRTTPFTPFRHDTYTSDDGGSIYFDGSGDDLQIAHSSLAFGQNDYTVEFWFYEIPGVSNRGLFHLGSQVANPGTSGIAFNLQNGTNNRLAGIGQNNDGSANWDGESDYGSAEAPNYNWHHFAMVRDFSASTRKCYLNGVQVLSKTGQTLDGADTYLAIGRYGGSNNTYTFKGYITDFRYVIGQTVYTGAFTPPSGPLTTTGGTYPSATNITNPTASQTKLLLNNTEAKVLDHSRTHNLKLYGNAQSDTGNQKYSVPALLLDGTGDYVDVPASSELDFVDGDWTIEGWFYLTSGYYLWDMRVQNGTDNQNLPALYWENGTGPVKLYFAGGVRITSTNVTQNTWTHIAVQKFEGYIQLYINGVMDSEAYGESNNYGPQRLRIGGRGTDAAGNAMAGSISDFRVTKDIARYPFYPLKETLTTTNTPMSTAVGNSGSDTQILACHHATITTQGGSHSATITANGNAAASDHAPFDGGRSVYLPDDNSFLTISAGDYKDFGTGDLTIECWFKQSQYSAGSGDNHSGLWGVGGGTFNNVSNAFSIAARGTTGGDPKLGVITASGGGNTYTTPATFSIVGQVVLCKGTWNHVACSKVSNVYYWFLNGSLMGTLSDSNSVNYNSSDVMYIGSLYGGAGNKVFHGWISNFRLIKGTGIYRQDFSPPGSTFKG